MTARLALVLLPLCVVACEGTKDFTFDAGPVTTEGDAGACDPFTQTNCPSNLKCTITGDGTPICGAKGSGQQYTSCEGDAGSGQTRGDDSLCAPGTACVDLEFQGYLAGNHCFPFCDLAKQPTDGGTTCPGNNATCLDLHNQIPQGFCDLPAPTP